MGQTLKIKLLNKSFLILYTLRVSVSTNKNSPFGLLLFCERVTGISPSLRFRVAHLSWVGVRISTGYSSDARLNSRRSEWRLEFVSLPTCSIPELLFPNKKNMQCMFFLFGAGNGNRTRLSTLARSHNNHYTIPALCIIVVQVGIEPTYLLGTAF